VWGDFVDFAANDDDDDDDDREKERVLPTTPSWQNNVLGAKANPFSSIIAKS